MCVLWSLFFQADMLERWRSYPPDHECHPNVRPFGTLYLLVYIGALRPHFAVAFSLLFLRELMMTE